MFALMSVHTPNPEHRDAVLASMHRFQDALRAQGDAGLLDVHTMADAESGRLVGFALFESAAAAQRLAPAAGAAVAGDDFATWEVVEMDTLRLTEA